MITTPKAASLTQEEAEQAKLQRLKKDAFMVSIEDIFEHHDKQHAKPAEKELIQKNMSGGEIFKCLSKYLEKNPQHNAVKISHPSFKAAAWNDYSDEVLVVKTSFNIPVRLQICGEGLHNYTVLRKKTTDDFIRGFVKLSEINA